MTNVIRLLLDGYCKLRLNNLKEGRVKTASKG